MSPYCDLDLEDSKTVFLYDNLPHQEHHHIKFAYKELNSFGKYCANIKWSFEPSPWHWHCPDKAMPSMTTTVLHPDKATWVTTTVLRATLSVTTVVPRQSNTEHDNCCTQHRAWQLLYPDRATLSMKTVVPRQSNTQRDNCCTQTEQHWAWQLLWENTQKEQHRAWAQHRAWQLLYPDRATLSMKTVVPRQSNTQRDNCCTQTEQHSAWQLLYPNRATLSVTTVVPRQSNTERDNCCTQTEQHRAWQLLYPDRATPSMTTVVPRKSNTEHDNRCTQTEQHWVKQLPYPNTVMFTELDSHCIHVLYVNHSVCVWHCSFLECIFKSNIRMKAREAGWKYKWSHKSETAIT